MCYISLKRVKLCRHGCRISALLLNAKMKIHIFENYMVIYTGRKMDKNQGNFREEQREYCKICRLLGKSASEIKSELDTVYGENTIPYRTVARWVSYFKEGRSSVKDEARPGRPVLATSENDVATFQSIVQQDSAYLVEEIKDLSGLSLSYVYTILKEKLKLQKICARWIPHLLTPEHKKDHVEKASVLLSRFKNQASHCLREVVSSDETWLYFFDPDNKMNNKMWVGENNERPVVARWSRSVRRVRYAPFFDNNRIVAYVSVPENCRVTGTFYSDIFLFFLPLLTTMTMHPLTILQWWSLIWRNFIFRSCHTHPTALTSLSVIPDLTHISNLAYKDINLRCAVLWAVHCSSV